MTTVKEYFTDCERQFETETYLLRRISLSLRREGIVTMEELCALQQERPEEIMKIRNIGDKGSRLIDEIGRHYAVHNIRNHNQGG